jgi:hypothetical protein
VETRFRQLGGSARLVSPREFALILEWFERRVPLPVVRSALEEAFAGGEGIGSLAYLRRPVERLFRAYRESRLGASAADGAATVTRGELREHLGGALGAVRREAARPGPAAGTFEEVASELSRLVEEAAEGEAGEGAPGLEALETRLARLDGRLLEAVRQRLGETRCASLASEAETHLAPHRGAMSAEVYERTLERHAERLLRSALGLPELSLFAL